MLNLALLLLRSIYNNEYFLSIHIDTPGYTIIIFTLHITLSNSDRGHSIPILYDPSVFAEK